MALGNTGSTPVVLRRGSSLPSLTNFTMTGWLYLDQDINAFVDFMWLMNDYFDMVEDYVYLGTSNDGTTLQNEVKGTTLSTQNNGALSIGVWYHLAYVKSGDTHKVYLSNESGSLDVSLRLDFTKATAVTPVWVAMLSDAHTRIMSVKMWEAALSVSEIRAERDTLSAIRTANLYLNTPLTTATDLADTSGNGRHWEQAQGVATTMGGPAILSGGTAPAAPSNFSADTSVYDQITLSWTDVADETGYSIEYCIGLGCTTFIPLATKAAGSTTHLITATSPGVVYRFRIRAFNASGESAWVTSGDVTVRTYAAIRTSTTRGHYLRAHAYGSDIFNGYATVRPQWGTASVVAWVRPHSNDGIATIAAWIQNFETKLSDWEPISATYQPVVRDDWAFTDSEYSYIWFGIVDGRLVLDIQDGRSLDRGTAPASDPPGFFGPPVDGFVHGEMRQRVTLTAQTQLPLETWSRVGFRWETHNIPPSTLDIGSTIQLWRDCSVIAQASYPCTKMNENGGVGYFAIMEYGWEGRTTDLFVGGIPDTTSYLDLYLPIVPIDIYDFKIIDSSVTVVMERECGCVPWQPQLWWKLRDIADLLDYGHAQYGAVSGTFTHEAVIVGSGFSEVDGVPTNPCNTYGITPPPDQPPTSSLPCACPSPPSGEVGGESGLPVWMPVNPYWTIDCLGGGDVPDAVNPTDDEDWDQ